MNYIIFYYKDSAYSNFTIERVTQCGDVEGIQYFKIDNVIMLIKNGKLLNYDITFEECMKVPYKGKYFTRFFIKDKDEYVKNKEHLDILNNFLSKIVSESL